MSLGYPYVCFSFVTQIYSKALMCYARFIFKKKMCIRPYRHHKGPNCSTLNFKEVVLTFGYLSLFKTSKDFICYAIRANTVLIFGFSAWWKIFEGTFVPSVLLQQCKANAFQWAFLRSYLRNTFSSQIST